MIGPKSSHLVERVAERLIQTGALNSPAARLFGSDRLPLPGDFGPPLPPAFAEADVLAPAFPAHQPETPESLHPGTSGQVIDAAALQRAGMCDWSGGRSRTSEEFRLVQRDLLRTAFAPDAEAGFANLLMVTSARPGEGKSFAALNLAGSIAQQADHKVLLIDCDTKNESVCHSLGLRDTLGILDLVADPKLDPGQVILKTEIENLSILPTGREQGRGSDVFASRDMIELIRRLGRRFPERMLILDTAPCLSTSDPAAFASAVGQVVFVVEAERTQRNEVEAALDLIQACPAIMLLLNKMQVSTSYTFGSRSDYYSS